MSNTGTSERILNMHVASRTDIGKVRTNNEDSILIDQERGIFLLADGMGGSNAGEVASRLAVEATHDFLKDIIGNLEGDKDILHALDTAFMKSHETVKQKGDSDIDLQDMGTTLVALVIKDEKAYVCHAGDSRAYLFRDCLQRLTKDHNLGEYSIEHESMKREEVTAQMWNIVTQAIGIYDDLEPDKRMVELEEGDILLLCSDGVTNMLTDEEITAILRKDRNNINEVADSLVADANEKGGRDNSSLILAAV